MTDGMKGLCVPLRLVLFVVAVAQFMSASAISLFMVKDVRAEPIDVTKFWMIMSWTYIASPVVGWISDSITVCGERRRPPVCLGVALNVVFIVLMFSLPSAESYHVFVGVALGQTVAQLILTIPLNALVVEHGRKAANDEAHITPAEREERVAAMQSAAMMWRMAG